MTHNVFPLFNYMGQKKTSRDAQHVFKYQHTEKVK